MKRRCEYTGTMPLPGPLTEDAKTLRRLLGQLNPRSIEQLTARLQPHLQDRYADPAVRVELTTHIARYLHFLHTHNASPTQPGETFLAYVKVLEDNNKPTSVSNQLSAIRTLYKILRELGALDAHLDPTGGYKHKVQTQKPKPPYPEEDVTRLLAHAKDDYVRAALLCCLDGGLIGKALLALNWEDIDFERSTLLTIKGEIPLTPALHDALEAHSRPYGGRLAQGRVFPRHKDDMALRRLLWQASRDANVTYRTWHGLYTTHALRVLRALPDTQARMDRLFLETERALQRYTDLLDAS